jgi:tRNA(adenine34) deaminase
MAQLTHRLWMEQALAEARRALEHDDVPVGAVVVRDGEALASAHNPREADADQGRDRGQPRPEHGLSLGGMAQLTHRMWMERALAQARQATEHGDVPVGAVVVRDGGVLAEARNRREADRDPTAHAEIVALRETAAALGSWRLEGCTLYVTLEPCTMCAGALVLARLPALVFGALDPKAGAVGSCYDIPRDERLNHRVDVTAGVMAEACGAELMRFFRARRGRGGRADQSQSAMSGTATLAGRQPGGVA